MKKLDRFLDFYLQEVNLIYAFWAMFWLLNGLDKFFIRVGAEPGATCTFSDGRASPCGWFGADRAMQMDAYFGKLQLPEWLGAMALHGFAVLEVLIGVAFAWMLLRSLAGIEKTTHVIHRLAFKGSFIVFLVFSAGDILFGDRRELWEHGTFLILVIITYRVYVDRNRLRSAVVRDLGRSETQKRPAIRADRDSVMYRREMVEPPDDPGGEGTAGPDS